MDFDPARVVIRGWGGDGVDEGEEAGLFVLGVRIVVRNCCFGVGGE